MAGYTEFFEIFCHFLPDFFKMAKNIHLYSSKECPHCIELKELLNKNNLPYEITDVDEEEKVWDELISYTFYKYKNTINS